MEEITYRPIGIIHTSFKEPAGTPIQASAARGSKGKAEIFPRYVKGLKDLEGFSHVILIYHFHLAKSSRLLAKPFLDDEEHGIFSIRGPSRPNAIGLSIVQLQKIKNNVLFFKDADMVDQTPLLDIKPFVPAFDHREVRRVGWLKERLQKLPHSRDDGRFSRK
ncbi:MAG: tRNA (N6-threonylcarbamoyladenosine(37)-N6)-methyltransferase TrmO [Candidatus Aminicenantes bacterium]|jgi:tRNA-Thr(GGU) m(6)t(6)A37 methyltransferase TsaA